MSELHQRQYTKRGNTGALYGLSCMVTGEALKDVDVPLTHIYASPALRCVETATHILQGIVSFISFNLKAGVCIC